MKKLLSLLKQGVKKEENDLMPKGWTTILPERTGDSLADFNNTWAHIYENLFTNREHSK